MRDFSELKMNHGGRPVDRPPPSPATISAFEREFVVCLPRDYISFLNYSNGGHPELDSIAPMGRTDIAPRAINQFFYLNEEQALPLSLWEATRAWRSVLGHKQIPIAEDGGGNPFVMDLTTAPPSIYSCLIEDGFDRVEIASSFVDFIDRLELDLDSI